MLRESESPIFDSNDLLAGIDTLREPQPDTVLIKNLPFDLTLKVATDNGYKFIETHKAVLIIYSHTFRASIIGGFRNVGNELTLEYNVSDISIMKKFIGAFYGGNFVETIKNTESCNERMELLGLCVFYAVNVPATALLLEGEATEDCELIFREVLKALRPNDIRWQDYIFDLKFEKIINTIYTNEFYFLVFLIEGTPNNTVNFLNLENNKLMPFYLKGEYHHIEYSRNRQRLMLYEGYQEEDSVEVWKMDKYPPETEYQKNFSRQSAPYPYISPDGTHLVIMEGTNFTVVNISTSGVVIAKENVGDLKHITISLSNKYIAYCLSLSESEFQIHVLSLDSDTHIGSFTVKSSIKRMFFTSDNLLLILTKDGTLSSINILQKTEKKFRGNYFNMWVTMNNLILISSREIIYNINLSSDNLLLSDNQLYESQVETNFPDDYYLHDAKFTCSDFYFAVLPDNRLDNDLEVFYLKNGVQVLRIQDPDQNILDVIL